MKAKFVVNLLLMLMIVFGIMTGTVAALAINDLDWETGFNVNEKGQTYGYFIPSENPAQQQMPQLIAAMGVDGTIGYVNVDELEGNLPENPQEAVEHMRHMEESASIAAATESEYIRYIPLYTEDGTTVIGQFGVGSTKNLDVIIEETE